MRYSLTLVVRSPVSACATFSRPSTDKATGEARAGGQEAPRKTRHAQASRQAEDRSALQLDHRSHQEKTECRPGGVGGRHTEIGRRPPGIERCEGQAGEG